MRRWGLTTMLMAALGLPAMPAEADPCGMVPPIFQGQQLPIRRVGPQKTYVFHKDGIETMVLRPGFSGKVDRFGMLIPFPSPPAIRKVDENLFPEIAAAIDPPMLTLDLSPPPPPRRYSRMKSAVPSSAAMAEEAPLAYDEVRVLRQEAVGMYEVAVLEAGSAKALDRWMTENGFVYPQGMDDPVNDYVAIRWVFVAVKTRVGSKSASDPKPGMKSVDPSLPPAATFDGHVQAMGFRFKSKEPVVPMRLSAFNEGEPHNVVYALMDKPVKIVGIDEAMVRRQLPGKHLRRNVVQPLPVILKNGKPEQITAEMVEALKPQRDPRPHNGKARDLFASDLAAVATGQLNLAFEEREKELLNIGENLNMRGPAVDALHHDVIEKERKQATRGALKHLPGLTMTVVDGRFNKNFLAESNLTFARYQLDAEKNAAASYNARVGGPRPLGIGKGDRILRGEIVPVAKRRRYYRIYGPY